MINTILAHLAPHTCVACGAIGHVICSDCYASVSRESYYGCIICNKPIVHSNVCSNHRLPYADAIVAGTYEATLEQLIVAYKIAGNREAHKVLGDLLASKLLARTPRNSVLVPIPTIMPHIRQRGFDHCHMLAKRVGTRLGLPTHRLLKRRSFAIQKGASRKTRTQQAREAFYVRKTLDPDVTYIVIDDVITTGATLRYAALALKNSGAHNIIVASASKVPDYVDAT